MLSATADHALRAVLILAREYGTRRVTAEEIADSVGAPRNYMGKTLNALAKQGVVVSSRGPAGGFALAVPPDQISLADIIDAFQPPVQHPRCLLGDRACDPSKPCDAHVRWSRITAARRTPFTTTTVADLAGRV